LFINLTPFTLPRRAYPLSESSLRPLLDKERGIGYVREAKPLFDFLYSGAVIREFRGATPL